MTQQPEFEFFVGIDRGVTHHQCCVVDRDGRVLAQRSVEHTAKAILAFADWLLTLCDAKPQRIAVGAEAPHGAIIELLMERGFAMFSINPKQLQRLRERHSVSGAKDDRRDAFALATSLRTDLTMFHRVELTGPVLLRLREISRVDDDLKSEFNALSNQLREQLHRYHPALLALCPSADEPWLWSLLAIASTPQALARLPIKTARTILKQHRIRRLTAEQLLEALKQPALPVADGVVQAVSAHVGLLLPRLQLVHRLRRQTEQQLGQILEELDRPADPPNQPEPSDTERSLPSDQAASGRSIHTDGGTSGPSLERASDVAIVLSMPGIGTRVASTILAEAPDVIARRDVEALRGYGGAAPVTKQSGKSRHVHMRYACNTRLRNAFHYMAGGAIKKEPQWKAYYSSLRAKGHSHSRALRTIADRLLTRLIAMLITGATYDKDLAHRTRKQRQEIGSMATA